MSAHTDSRARLPDSRITAGGGIVLLGAAGLLLALGATGMLVWGRLSGLGAPGCGEGSPCAQAAASAWGRIPGTNWPSSYVGTAYFLAALVAWLVARGRISSAARWAGRCGAAWSLVLIGAMVTGGYVCGYCMAVHAGNLLFAACSELAGLSAARVAAAGAAASRGARVSSSGAALRWAGLPAALVVFAVASAGLAGLDGVYARRAEAKAEGELRKSTEEIISKLGNTSLAKNNTPNQSRARQGADGAPPASPPHAPPAVAGRPATPDFAALQPQLEKVFTGRYHFNKLPSPIRIVVFSDYQCADCKRLETTLFQIAEQRPEVCLSAKQFPLCTDCNRYASKTLHQNACWAARAAEAAGLIGGNDAFWRMHRWLFARGGAFTDAELHAGLLELGFDPVEFTRVMQSEQTLRLVQEDIDEGTALGLSYTPMLFVNGIELRGWGARDALQRTIDAIMSQAPELRGPEQDRPPPALQKFIGDWKAMRRREIAPRSRTWPRGAAAGPVRVVVFGDYREGNSIELDAAMREIVARRTDVQYEFRLFPFHGRCNPIVKVAGIADSCRAAQAAVAAGMLGGADAYWLVHEWMVSQGGDVLMEDALLEAMAAELTLDPAQWLAAMNSAEVQAVVAEDVAALGTLKIKGIPTAYINGREVPRWKLGDTPIIERLIDEALRMP